MFDRIHKINRPMLSVNFVNPVCVVCFNAAGAERNFAVFTKTLHVFNGTNTRRYHGLLVAAVHPPRRALCAAAAASGQNGEGAKARAAQF
jgi:hypothetical protein